MLTLLSGILEGAYLEGDETSTIRDFLRMDWANPLVLPGQLIGNLNKVLWFDYAFFDGEWAILRYIFFLPISIGVVISYGALLVQAAIVAIRGVVGGLARLVRP